jgi:hypothetical protein
VIQRPGRNSERDHGEKCSNATPCVHPGSFNMCSKIIVIIPALILCGSAAFAQDVTPSRDNPSGSVVQPHGPTGPINTKSGGAPASSPQGETPAGMQAAPKGSSEAVRTDEHGVVEGTPKN